MGDRYELSTLHATVHLGAHADAPSHYGAGAPTIDQRDPAIYLGPCRVLRVASGACEVIGPAVLPDPLGETRILLATGTYPDPEYFRRDFASVSPDLVERLARGGGRLLGVDTPSIDAFASEDLPAHKACLEHDVSVLEGLWLEGVPEGRYELIALPLKLVGFDASPVRAVLRTLDD